MNTAWILAGGAALTGLVATCWRYIRGFYLYMISWLIIRVTVRGYQSDAFQLYFREQFKASRFGPRLYTAWLLHVRPRNRTQLVSMEVIGSTGKLFWMGRKPVWVAKATNDDDSGIEGGVNARDYNANALTVTFIRGAFKPDELVFHATEYFNRQMVAFDEEGLPLGEKKSRHYVRHIFGTAGKPMGQFQSHNEHQQPSTAGDTRACRHHRPVGWEFDQLGTQREQIGSPIDRLALGPEAMDLVAEARFWKDHEKWYLSRGIPWRRGWLLHGSPGTGKTALIRAIAEDLDLPVFIYDLASMFNEELQVAWSRMLSEVPCMAVIEDIDAVFHGRQNIVGRDQNLTFDCLLNCLDGIQRSNGLFVTITTNQLDQIDPALGCPDGGISTRPGRIDRTLQLGPLNEDARIRIASRILRERIDLQEWAVQQGDGDTVAQFQERCSRLALEMVWGGKQPGPAIPPAIDLQLPMDIPLQV